MELEAVLRELPGAILSSVFDPPPIVFRFADEEGITSVRMSCNKPLDEVHFFRRALNRNAFLCGCLDFTQDESGEHLIIGLGKKYGGTTKVSALAHNVGTTNQVNPSVTTLLDMQTHLMSYHRSEVLIFHNHPGNQLNILFDNRRRANQDLSGREWFCSRVSHS